MTDPDPQPPQSVHCLYSSEAQGGAGIGGATLLGILADLKDARAEAEIQGVASAIYSATDTNGVLSDESFVEDYNL